MVKKQMYDKDGGHDAHWSGALAKYYHRLSVVHHQKTSLANEKKKLHLQAVQYQQQLHEAVFRLHNCKRVNFHLSCVADQREKDISTKRFDSSQEHERIQQLTTLYENETRKVLQTMYEQQMQRECDETRHILVRDGLYRRLCLEKFRGKEQALLLAQVQRDLHNADQSIADLQKKNETTQHTLKQANSRIMSLQSELQTAALNITRLETTELDLKQRMKDDHERLSQQDRQIFDMKGEVNTLRLHLEHDACKLKEYKKKEEELSSDIHRLTYDILLAQNKIKQGVTKVEQMRDKLRCTQQLHQAKLHDEYMRSETYSKKYTSAFLEVARLKGELFSEKGKTKLFQDSLNQEHKLIHVTKKYLHQHIACLQEELRHADEQIINLHTQTGEHQLQLMEKEEQIRKMTLLCQLRSFNTTEPKSPANVPTLPFKLSRGFSAERPYDPLTKNQPSECHVEPIAAMRQKSRDL